MSISRQNLTIVIVTFKSNNVIHNCIKSIDKDTKIIVIDNSNDNKFKQELEETYKNVSCILSNENLGMGCANNVGIKKVNTDFVFVLNPDVVLENDTIDELIKASKNFSDFAIFAPISSDLSYPNYQMFTKDKISVETNSPFKVKSVDGFAMLFNKNKIDKIVEQENLNINNDYFDKNFFMYLENDDLCKRIIKNNGDIYVIPKSKINHLGAKAVDEKYKNEIEYSRNWHWVWSKFYFRKKHYGYLKAFLCGFPKFFLSSLKYVYYLIINNKYKKRIYFNRTSGFLNAAIGKTSWYRPNINF
jgi:N-acetylglucosaminyl-diphospho-decaprenol L-rhamnosyltransferase